MTTKPHKHAELFRELAEDGEAWRNWEWFNEGFHSCFWVTACTFEQLISEDKIRRKPTPAQYIKIGDKRVPAPCREPLKIGQEYFSSYTHNDIVLRSVWNGDEFDLNLLRAGRIHLTEEAAQAHVDAERIVNTTLVDENGNKINP